MPVMSIFTILLITAVLSFMPISELRGAIPFAMVNDIPWYAAFLFSVAFNALIAPICWLFLATIHKFMYGIHWYHNIFDRFIERARTKLSGSMDKWGWLGIALFVGIPLPVTGAWTGTLGAWVLGVSRRRTILAVTLGVIISGIIVTTVMTLGIEALNFFVKRMDV